MDDEITDEVNRNMPPRGLGVRYQVRKNNNQNVWFVYDAADERVVDIHYGPFAEATIQDKCDALNDQLTTDTDS